MDKEGSEMFAELASWLKDLDRAFAFLLILPFLVAAAGLLSNLAGRRESTRAEREPAPRPSGKRISNEASRVCRPVRPDHRSRRLAER
jgi:hypothetical protein